jgi:hypothetical protein
MSTTVVDTTGLDRLRAQLERLANPDPTPLLIRWADLMDRDNRLGVLAGTDGAGQPMDPVTYRPAKPGSKSVKLTVAQRLGQSPRKSRGKYSRSGSGAHTNNNLTSAEYRLLDGPPLAPRKQFSRVITNYMQSFGMTGINRWEVVGAWVNVLSKKGVPFLRYHFDGEGQKRRDLRGIRPAGFLAIRETTRNWIISEIRRGSP